MKMPNLFALSAAVMITAFSLSTVLADQPYHRVSHVNGVKIVDLPAVSVTPSAEDRRAAALLSSTAEDGTDVVAMDSEASLNSSPLSMPYYSFGSEFGRISKE
jgi:hypothetical protein